MKPWSGICTWAVELVLLLYRGSLLTLWYISDFAGQIYITVCLTMTLTYVDSVRKEGHCRTVPKKYRLHYADTTKGLLTLPLLEAAAVAAGVSSCLPAPELAWLLGRFSRPLPAYL